MNEGKQKLRGKACGSNVRCHFRARRDPLNSVMSVQNTDASNM